VVDTQAPVFLFIPPDISVNTYPYVNYALGVTWTPPVARDNVAVAAIICNHASGRSI
jgi:hypothetical protein